MCDPVSLTVASGAVSLATQQIAYGQQKKYQSQVFNATKKAADQDALLAYQALTDRQVQEHEKAAQALQSVQRQAVAARGAARTSAAEGNVQGNSVGALDDDFTRAETEYQSQVIRNQAFLDSQFKNERLGVQAKQTAAIQSGIGQPIQPPQYLNQIIGSYSKVLEIQYKQNNNQNPWS